MSISFVPKREFLPADNDTLRRRLQSVLGVETGPASDTEGLGETCGYRHPVDLQSGVRLTAARCYRRGITSPPPHKALAVIQIIAAIAEDAPLHRALFARKQRISLGDLEQMMNAAVRTGLWKLAEYTGRLHPDDWGPDWLHYYIDLKEWNSHVASNLRCETLTVQGM